MADSEQRQQQLRQLSHDVNTLLGIIVTGLQAIEAVRHEPQEVEEMCSVITQDGVKPLQGVVAEIIRLSGAHGGGEG